jgi:uncharacterized membrane protein YphA (DoxX/SURF4 family)
VSFIVAVSQVAIVLGIVNVWVIRRNRATAYRPDGANNIVEEFERYGLPRWAPIAVGSTKLALATLLLIGLVYTPVVFPAAALMVVMMLSAIAAHIKVRDPLVRSVPASLMLALSIVVAVTYAP